MVIKAGAIKLQDKEVLDNIAECPDQFRYHNQFKTKKTPNPIQCYKIYTSRMKRAPELPSAPAYDPTEDPEDKTAVDTFIQPRKSTRSRSHSGEFPSPTLPEGKKCKKEHIVCSLCLKRSIGSWPNAVYELYRVSEMKLGSSRASKFLSAMKFNEDHVYREYIYCETVKDIFAADVYYHNKCMSNYIRTYERQVELILLNFRREDAEDVFEGVDLILGDLDFNAKAYKLTEITKLINDEMSLEFDNRRTKSQLIKFFGEKICFSYSGDRSQPQVVYKRSVQVCDIIEGNLRKYDAIKECAQTLAEEIKSYSFNLDDSLCLPSDITLAMNRFTECRPSQWLKFVSELFSSSRFKQQEEWISKFDTAFQFFFHWLSGEITPMHCAITQMIHCLSKSKEMINNFCRLGFAISYSSMKRIDIGIAQMIRDKAGDSRGPVSDKIQSGIPIQGSVDNFNHRERTPTGGDVSNDTVLVIWQNNDNVASPLNPNMMSKRPPGKSEERLRSFDCHLPCQEVLESNLIKNTGMLAEGFTPITDYIHKNSLEENAEEEYFTYFSARNLQHPEDDAYTSTVPSLTAVKSKLLSAVFEPPKVTSCSFYPILPSPATTMDSIYTSMVNFQDVLEQRGETSGALWCDEGVYCLAKEIQLLKPEQFGNIFLGLGPFHWSKILMGAVGKWLSSSGIGEALSNSGIFTPEVAKSSVLKGGDYVKAKEGMGIIAEAITLLQYRSFLKSEYFALNKHELGLDEIQFDMNEVFVKLFDASDVDTFQGAWELTTVSLMKLRTAFKTYQKSQEGSQNFEYWNIFLNFMYPCVRDFETSVRTGKFDLYLSAVERSLTIFFATGKPNYSRYGSLFYQDCLDLQRKFPGIHKHFKKGLFVCHLSERHGSGIGFDQGLEKIYNHTAKAAGGIIGMTRRKKAVALWDIIKHQKDLFVSFMRNTVNVEGAQTELDSLHHEFNIKAAQFGHKRCKQLVTYIESVSNPFSSTVSNKLINITTQEAVENVDYLLNCIEHGRKNYDNFVQERFADKTKGLHDRISFKYDASRTEEFIVEKQKKIKIPKDEQENDSAVNFIQYSLSRGYKVEDLLKFPITSRPVYLLEADSVNQKKTSKSDLTNSLLQQLDKTSIIVCQDNERIPHIKTSAVVIDFMSVVRKFSAVQMSNIKTFGSFCDMILGALISYGRGGDSIHVILENYSEMSVKSAERARRATKGGISSSGLCCEVVSGQQPLPPSFQDEFFKRTSNKISFQDFFVNFCTKSYTLTKPLYIAGGCQSDPAKCTKISAGICQEEKSHRATHEEADDRIMYSVNRIYQSMTPHSQCSIVVVSPDADIFATLLYHLNKTWHGTELYLLKKGRVKEQKVLQYELYPLHKLTATVGSNVVNNLPAAHALTGCDSVAKVGTKTSMLKTLKTSANLIEQFGLDRLDEEMIDQAELFLVRVIASKAYEKCLTFDELRVKMYKQTRDRKFIKLPCSSNEIRQNIRRAYYQTRMWLEAAFGDAREFLDVENFGFDSAYQPVWFIPPERPPDIPLPCGCKSCVRRLCPCRQKNIPCSDYCKCVGNCKSPFTDAL